jgi:hypothetical protein
VIQLVSAQDIPDSLDGKNTSIYKNTHLENGVIMVATINKARHCVLPTHSLKSKRPIVNGLQRMVLVAVGAD